MEECHPISTPAEARALGSDPDGPAISEQWSYKSLVGMLLIFLETLAPISHWQCLKFAALLTYPNKAMPKPSNEAFAT